MKNIYEFKAKESKEQEISLEEYRGKVLLIVNTATGCGYTPQYKGLEELYKKHRESGFEILDFPCNQFLDQAPGNDDEIKSFCELNFGTEFKTFAKIDVNGENTTELYKYLREQAPTAVEDEVSLKLYKLLLNYNFSTTGDEIKWNFTKFLVNREGKVVARFTPTTEPSDIEKFIVELL